MKFRNVAILLLLATLSSLEPALAQRTDDNPFFRDGQESLEREIENLEQQRSSEDEKAPAPLTIDDTKLQWQKYVFRDGGFSIWMPEGVQSKETLVLNTTEGEMAFELVATRPKSYSFLAAYSNQIGSSASKNPETLLASVRDSIVANSNLKLTGDRDIAWQDYSGKQLNLQGDNEQITYRVYVIEQRIYLLAVGQQSTGELSSDAVNFFDSFRLLE